MPSPRQYIDPPQGFSEWYNARTSAGVSIENNSRQMEIIDGKIVYYINLVNVPFHQRFVYLHELLGGVEFNGSATKLPIYLDEWSGVFNGGVEQRLYCMHAKWSGWPQDTQNTSDGLHNGVAPPRCKIECVFEDPGWVVNATDPNDDPLGSADFPGLILSEHMDFSTQFIKVTNQRWDVTEGKFVPALWWFREPGDPVGTEGPAVTAQEAPGKLIRSAVWRVRLHMLPDPVDNPLNLVHKLGGMVNSDILYSPKYKIRFDENTLLMNAPQIERRQSSYGEWEWTVDFEMAWNPSFDPYAAHQNPPAGYPWLSGWNLFPRGPQLNREPMYRTPLGDNPNQIYTAQPFGGWLPVWISP